MKLASRQPGLALSMVTTDCTVPPSNDAIDFGRLFENALDAMVVFDSNARFIDANDAACKLFGLDRAQLLGRNVCSSMEDGFDLSSWVSQLKTETTKRNRRWLLRGDGSRCFVETSLTPNVLPGRHLAIYRDITDEYLLEKEVVQAEKHESLARLAAGIAHDFTNLLNVICGHTELLIHEVGGNYSVQRHTDSILAATKQAAVMASQLSAYGGQRPLTPELLDLNSITFGLKETLRNVVGPTIRLEVQRSQAALPKIKADRVQLGRILLTLISNAKEVISESGSITIESSAISLPSNVNNAQFRVPAGEYVMLSVHAKADSGEASKASEKHNSRRPIGTELRLPGVYASVRACEGFLWVDSPGQSEMTFRLYFPPMAEDATADYSQAESSEDLSGTGTILLAEDEPVLRETTREYLKCLGYHVLRAANGEEALAAARSCSEEIHLLVTDLKMPKLGGKALAEQLLMERPRTRVVYMTATADSPFVHEQVAKGRAHVVLKPFAMRALARVIREILKQPPQVSRAQA